MRFLGSITAIVGGCAGFFAGRSLPLETQWPFFEALRTTGSIVFGVMGALLAIVYPEVVKNGFRSIGNPVDDTKNLQAILSPLVQSAMILFVIVFLGPVSAWVGKAHDSEYVRGASFALLTMLTVWQLWVLLLVLRPLDILWTHTGTEKLRAAARKRRLEFGPDTPKK